MFVQLLAFEAPALDFDITLFIQFGIFLLLMLALRKYVLQPYLKAYDARESLTVGAQEEAREMECKALEVQKQYEQERQRAYSEVDAARKHEISEVSAEASRVVEQARERVQSELKDRQRDFEADLEQARRMAAVQVEKISAEITQKILV